MSQEEKAAQKIIPIRNPKLKGPLGSKYLLGKLGLNSLSEVTTLFKDERIAYEVFNFIDGKNSLLDIKNAVSAEFEPVSLQEIKKFYEALAQAGIITLK
jgi:aminopeptidase-like protein